MNEKMSKIDLDQVYELWTALQRNGWTNCDVKAVSSGNFLNMILNYIKENYINLDDEPDVPNGEQIIHNNKGGLWKFNPKEILFCPKTQYTEKEFYDYGFNANLLDYLLKNPEKIPNEWKSYDQLLFPGTFYSTLDNWEQIRTLSWKHKWGTITESEWRSESLTFNEILKSKDNLVFVMRQSSP